MTIPGRIGSFFDTLHFLGIRYLVGGSFASSLWGQARQTHDIDLSILLDAEESEQLIGHIGDEYMWSESDVRSAVCSTDEFRSFQLLYIDELFKIDVFVAYDTEYHRAALQRSRPHRMWADLELQFSSPEDSIISKLRWFELGNRVSDKQWNDIIGILEVQAGELDEEYLEKWTQHFGVDELLVKARSEVL